MNILLTAFPTFLFVLENSLFNFTCAVYCAFYVATQQLAYVLWPKKQTSVLHVPLMAHNKMCDLVNAKAAG